MLAWAACAQIREPQGGAKDTAAPELVYSDPANGSIRFAGDRIILRFSERVKLDRVRERMLVSPPLEKAPDVTVVRGTDVVIALNAPLIPNTTYTFNIGEAVVDLSEGNPAAGLAFVVSTGDHVDSLALAGQVLDAFTGKPATEVLVMLHADGDTGDVRTAPPAFFTRTKKDGRFTLTHLPARPMRLYALSDRNGNYRYDLPNEEIAYVDGPILPGDTTEYSLFLFQARSPTQFVASAKVLPERGWQMALARPAGELSIGSMDREDGRLEWWQEWNPTHDTVVFWPSDTTLLNGQRFWLREDALVLDTLTYRATMPQPFNLGLKVQGDRATGRWRLESTRPVAGVDPVHAELLVDSAKLEWQVHPDSIRGRFIGLELQPAAGRSVELVLYPKAVTAIMGGTNDTARLHLSAPDPRSLGRLRVEFDADSGSVLIGPFVLQLMSGQGRVVREAFPGTLPAAVDWAGIEPGTYSLKLIQDSDGDGRWTTGALNARQPEAVFLDAEPVVIRAGWAVERSWTVAERP